MIPPCIVTDKIHILPFLAINKQKTTPQNPIIYVYLKVFRSLLFHKPCHHSCTFENLKHALSALHNSYTPRFQSQRKKKKNMPPQYLSVSSLKDLYWSTGQYALSRGLNSRAKTKQSRRKQSVLNVCKRSRKNVSSVQRAIGKTEDSF